MIKPVNPKGNWSWIFIGRTAAEAETPILWLPDGKNWLTGKDSDAGKDWRREEKWTTEDETVGWHHRFNRHELQQTLGGGEGQGGLVCCSPWDAKSSTQLSDWTAMPTITFWIVSDGAMAVLSTISKRKAWRNGAQGGRPGLPVGGSLNPALCLDSAWGQKMRGCEARSHHFCPSRSWTEIKHVWWWIFVLEIT